jgi:predicted RNase H-like nuclease (RuvC/YqgF family)
MEYYRERANEATRLLCLLCAQEGDEMHPEVAAWYANHLKEDEERLKKEAEEELQRQIDRRRRAIAELAARRRSYAGDPYMGSARETAIKNCEAKMAQLEDELMRLVLKIGRPWAAESGSESER